MIDTILKTLKNEIGGDLLSANVPENKIDDILKVVGDVSKKEVTNQMKEGNLSTVMNLFSNKTNSSQASGLQSNIQNGVIAGLISKLGISDKMANMISGIVVPALLKLITNKNSETPDDDASPLESIFSPKGGGLGKKVGGILGGFMKS